MSCCINDCKINKLTTDGYCYQHSYMTNTDDYIILNHIRTKLDEINKAYGVDRFRKMLRLGGYISYKKKFFLKIGTDSQLFNTAYNKYIERNLIEEALDNGYNVLEADRNYFNNIRERINIIKNELEST